MHDESHVLRPDTPKRAAVFSARGQTEGDEGQALIGAREVETWVENARASTEMRGR